MGLQLQVLYLLPCFSFQITFLKINYNFKILQVTASCIICLQEILAMYCKKLLQRLARFSCTVLQDTIAMFCKTFSHTFFLAQFCKKLLQRFARFSCTVLQNTIAMFCKIFLHSFARYFCNVLQDFLAVLQNTFATFWQEAFKIFYKTLHLTFFSKIFQWFSLLLPLALPTIPWDHKYLWWWFVWLSPPPPQP